MAAKATSVKHLEKPYQIFSKVPFEVYQRFDKEEIFNYYVYNKLKNKI